MRFHPDVTGTAPLVTALATDLVKKGIEVIVIASQPHYGGSIPSKPGGVWLEKSVYEGVQLYRTRVRIPRNAGQLERSLNYLSYNLLCTFAAMTGRSCDVCLCISPPITVGMTGILVRHLRRTPLVFVVQDIWPDCLAAVGQLKSKWLLHVLQQVERLIYREAARLVVVSRGMKDYLVEQGVPARKVAVISNWADVDEIKPLPKNNGFRKRYGLGEDFVILFAGNIGFNSELEFVVDAAERLKTHPSIRILIVGEGNAKPALLQRAERLGVKNLQFLPRQPQEVVVHMLSACDLGLVTLNGKLGRLNVPSKTYPIMASARPVLASVGEDSEVYRLIQEADCGFWVPPGDSGALADAIARLSEQPDRLQSAGWNGREYVERYCNRARGVEEYLDLLEEVSGT